MDSIDPRALRSAFGTFMTGVTVVTTTGPDGEPLGFTANSFTSVSIDPPLILVCVANSSRNYDAFNTASGFAVNILSEAQIDVSNTFARPVEDRFATVDWQSGPVGSPVLDGVSAWFDCSMFKTVDAGDHLILIGKVEAFESNAHPGLGFSRGAYVTPAIEAEALGNKPNLVVTALIEFEGRVLLVEGEDGHLTAPGIKVGKEGASTALNRLLASLGANAEQGFIYSVYEDEARETQHISFLCHAADEATSEGAFSALSEPVLAKVADSAMRIMLERFARESVMGNFGVYCGNQTSGKVRPMTPRS